MVKPSRATAAQMSTRALLGPDVAFKFASAARFAGEMPVLCSVATPANVQQPACSDIRQFSISEAQESDVTHACDMGAQQQRGLTVLMRALTYLLCVHGRHHRSALLQAHWVEAVLASQPAAPPQRDSCMHALRAPLHLESCPQPSMSSMQCCEVVNMRIVAAHTPVTSSLMYFKLVSCGCTCPQSWDAGVQAVLHLLHSCRSKTVAIITNSMTEHGHRDSGARYDAPAASGGTSM